MLELPAALPLAAPPAPTFWPDWVPALPSVCPALPVVCAKDAVESAKSAAAVAEVSTFSIMCWLL